LDKDGRDKKIYLNEGDLSKLGKFVDYFHVFKKK